MPTVSLEFLTEQLELGEQLLAGRPKMISPQDLPGRYGRVVACVDFLLGAIGCEAVVGGGWAVWHHGYVARLTHDLDIVLPADRIDEFLRVASVSGFEVLPQLADRWPKVLHKETGIEVDILPEGARPGTISRPAPTTIPHPKELGAGGRQLRYVSLARLIELKLAAGRSKDETDVVIFIAKLDAAGTFQWATRLGESNDSLNIDEGGFAIAVDGQGNVFTTGKFFSGGNGRSIFVARHDTSGNLLWLAKMGQPTVGGGEGHDLAVDNAGNVYVTGQFNGKVDFNPGSGTYTLSSTVVKGLADNWDAFAVSLTSNGSFRWAFNIVGNKNDSGNAIAVDGTGNIYLAGDFASTSNDFDPSKSKVSVSYAGGYSDIFVAKYTSGRSLVWARRLGGADEDHLSAMALDGAGNIYLTGHFWGTADFDPAAGSFTLTNTGSRDAFVAQLNSAGNFVWAGQMGGPVYQASGNDLAVDGQGNVYVVGYFKGEADFDPNAGEYLLDSTLDAAGAPTVDGFFCKLVPLGSLQASALDIAIAEWAMRNSTTGFTSK